MKRNINQRTWKPTRGLSVREGKGYIRKDANTGKYGTGSVLAHPDWNGPVRIKTQMQALGESMKLEHCPPIMLKGAEMIIAGSYAVTHLGVEPHAFPSAPLFDDSTSLQVQESPDFTMKDKEWIDKIDGSKLTLQDIL